MGQFKTPLRYPGGKQKLTPFIAEILFENNLSGHYVEPYAGGAGVALNLLISHKVSTIHLNDINPGIYSFWYSVLNHTEEFCQLISRATLTVEEWRKRKEIVKRSDTSNLLELGFSTFYLNRCNRSGVLSGGLIGGLDQTGLWKMDARFSRKDLIHRIETIRLFKDSIFISNMDAEEFIYDYIPQLPENTLIYLDPPYFEKARELYLDSYSKDDHSKLASVIQGGIGHKWVLSYDAVSEILGFYKNRRSFQYNLQYNASKVYKGREVFIFCDNISIPKSSILACIDPALKSCYDELNIKTPAIL